MLRGCRPTKPDARVASTDDLVDKETKADGPRWVHLMNQQPSHPQFPRIEESVRIRTETLAVAAHELKTPLSIIAAYLQLLLSCKVGSLNERQRQALDECERSCQRLLKSVGGFLSLAQQEAGKLEMDYELGDLAACLAEVHRLFVPLFREKGVNLSFSASPAVPRFHFDYTKTSQVVIALLDNALKFTPSKGTVTLRVEPFTGENPPRTSADPREVGQIGLLHSSDYIQVSVSDTGPGIPPEYHETIFEAFVKVPQPTGYVEGAGLGLAIARRLIEAQGGRIWVGSTPGKGSTFVFLFPSVRRGDPGARRM